MKLNGIYDFLFALLGSVMTLRNLFGQVDYSCSRTGMRASDAERMVDDARDVAH
jgi:hypothetical protein